MGGRQLHSRPQLGIREGFLREALAIVERSLHGHSRHVTAEVVNCASCTSLTWPSGYSTTTRVPATPRKACATALPVSPDAQPDCEWLRACLQSDPRAARGSARRSPEGERRTVKTLDHAEPFPRVRRRDRKFSASRTSVSTVAASNSSPASHPPSRRDVLKRLSAKCRPPHLRLRSIFAGTYGRHPRSACQDSFLIDTAGGRTTRG